MQEELDHLLELSEVDKKIFQLKNSKKDLPLRIETLRVEVAREKDRLDRIVSSIQDTESKIRENQGLGEAEQHALEGSNHKLENISTNREYDAVHSEIATHKRNIDNAQANVIHFRQVLENYQKEREEAEADYQRIRESNEPELKQLTAELNGIEDRIAEQVAKAAGPRQKVGRRLLSVYDRIMSRRNTPYVISRINREQRACEICNRTQTPQKVNDIAKRNNLYTCESCGSILIWKE